MIAKNLCAQLRVMFGRFDCGVVPRASVGTIFNRQNNSPRTPLAQALNSP